MSSHNRTIICEKTLLGAFLGFSMAWLASSAPSLIRLAAPALFACATWILVASIKPWLVRYFHGSASNSRILISRICICAGSWITIWLLLGASRNYVFANSLYEAIYADHLSVALLIAFGVTAAVIAFVGFIFPLIGRMIHIQTIRDSSGHFD